MICSLTNSITHSCLNIQTSSCADMRVTNKIKRRACFWSKQKKTDRSSFKWVNEKFRSCQFRWPQSTRPSSTNTGDSQVNTSLSPPYKIKDAWSANNFTSFNATTLMLLSVRAFSSRAKMLNRNFMKLYDCATKMMGKFSFFFLAISTSLSVARNAKNVSF